MIRRGAYCDVGTFTTYLAGYGKAPILAKEEKTLLLALESTTERMDRYCDWRTFQPLLGTCTWDAYIRPFAQGGIGVEGPQGVGGWVGGGGSGDITFPSVMPGVTDLILARGSHWTEWLYPDGPDAGAELDLKAWLCGAPTSVVLIPLDPAMYNLSPITLEENVDYQLRPADGMNPPMGNSGSDQLPASRLRLTPDRVSTIIGTPYRLAITGSWGWSDDSRPLTDDAGDPITLAVDLAPTDTTMTVSTGGGAGVFAGQTFWIEDEQLYVRHVPISGAPSAPVGADAGIVIERGVNGTGAAAHTAADVTLELQLYARDAAWCCMEIARNRFRGRIMGALATFSEGRVMLSETEETTLKRLDSFLRPREEAAFVPGFA